MESKTGRRDRLLALVWVLCLCTGFDWPGQEEHYRAQFRHGSLDERLAALPRLSEQSDPATTELLLRALEDRATEVRTLAAQVLSEAQVSAALPVLVDLTHSGLRSEKEAALRALGRAPLEPRGLAALVDALGVADPRIQVAALASLQRADIETLQAHVLPLLQTASVPAVQAAAARALARESLGPSNGQAATALLRLVEATTSNDVKDAAVSSLAAMKGSEARDALLTLAENEHLAEDTRTAATMALGRHPEAEPALLRILKKSEGRLFRGAAQAAAASGGSQARTALLEASLNAATSPVRRIAAGMALLAAAKRAPAGDDVLGSFVAAAASRPVVQVEGEILGRILSPFLAEVGTTHSAPSDRHPAAAALLVPFAEQVPSEAVVEALSRTGDPQATAALLQLLPRRPELRDAVLAGLLRLARGEAPAEDVTGDVAQGKAQETARARTQALLQAFPQASEGQQVHLVQLLGPSTDPEVTSKLLEVLREGAPTLQLTAAEALQRHPRAGARDALLTHLTRTSGASPQLRFASAAALGSQPDLSLDQLGDLLDGPRYDRAALLQSVTVALTVPTAAPLPAALRKRLKKRLSTLALEAAPDVASEAVRAMGALTDGDGDGVATELGAVLTRPGQVEREIATRTLGRLPPETARPLLRYLLRKADPALLLDALSALAEVGDQRDLEALLRAAEREPHPVPELTGFVIARWLERGAISARTAQRALCSLIRRPSPILRANLAAALSRTRAVACTAAPAEQEMTAAALLQLSSPEVERYAGALWARAAVADPSTVAGPFQQELQDALQECATRDPSPAVRSLCQGESSPVKRPEPPLERLLVTDSDGIPTALSFRAVQFMDGTVWIGRTDSRGQLWMGRSLPGVRLMLDPGLLAVVPESSP